MKLQLSIGTLCQYIEQLHIFANCFPKLIALQLKSDLEALLVSKFTICNSEDVEKRKSFKKSLKDISHEVSYKMFIQEDEKQPVIKSSQNLQRVVFLCVSSDETNDDIVISPGSLYQIILFPLTVSSLLCLFPKEPSLSVIQRAFKWAERSI